MTMQKLIKYNVTHSPNQSTWIIIIVFFYLIFLNFASCEVMSTVSEAHLTHSIVGCQKFAELQADADN